MGKMLQKFFAQYKVSRKKLSFREMITLAIPGPASVICPIIIHNSLIKFYTDVIGIDAKYMGLVYLLYNIWNAINDPLLGVWVDRLKFSEKRGKYVYLMRVTAPVMILSTFGMLLSSPGWSDWVVFFVFLAELFVFDTAYTVYSVAYQSYFLLAAASKEERVDVDVIRTFIGNVIGSVTTVIPTLLLVGDGEKNRTLIVTVFSLVLLFNAVLYIIALTTLKEKGELYAHETHEEKRPFRETWKEAISIIRSRQFLTYLIFYITARGAMEAYYNPFLYFMDDVVKSSGTVATIADVVPGLIMLAVLPMFGNKIKQYGSKTMSIVSLFPAMLGFGGLMFVSTPAPTIVCYTLIVTSLNVCQRAGVVINGDLIDDDERRTGIRKTGMYGGLFSLFATSLTSVQSLLFTNIISHYGYDGQLAVQSARTVLGIRIGAGLVPLIMCLIGLIPMLLFPIGRKKEKELSLYMERMHGVKERPKMIKISGRDFTDSEGNKVELHGINMVCKDRRMNHIGDYKDVNFKYLKSLGMNVIRLGIFWESVEPEPGRFDDEYLESLDRIIKLAGDNGIYTYLDMHQDLYGAKFEDGAPDWAVITDGKAHVRTELWSDSYLLSGAVQAAFDNFWNNAKASDGKGLIDHYVTMWKYLANRYAKNQYVIGYDVLNEPFPGSPAAEILGIIAEVKEKLVEGTATESDLFKTIKAIEPITGAFEEAKLIPFYERIARAIREVDSESFIMLETNYFSNAGVPTHVRPVKYANGEVIPNQVFGPHGYDIFVDTDMYSEPDNSRVDLIFGTHASMAEEMGIPVIIGEWGCFPNATDAQILQARHLKELFTAMNAGETYFDFSHIYNNRIVEALENR